MRIGIDCRFAVRPQPRGIGRYTEHLVGHLVKSGETHDYCLYVDGGRRIERLPSGPHVRVRRIRPSLYPAWEQAALPLAARADRIDVLHCTGNTGPIRLWKGIKMIVTIHDVSYFLPEDVMPRPTRIYQRLGRTYRRWVVPRAARRADAIVAVSHHARNEIAQVLSIEARKIHIVYHGVTVAPSANGGRYACRVSGLPERYLLSMGGDAPHKNVERVIRVYGQLVASKRHRGCHLVVLGMSKQAARHYSRQATLAGCRGMLHFIEFVAENAELAEIYQRAVCVLNPSLNESFGLPTIEAMACGVPVVASKVGGIPEVVGNAAVLVDPRSDSELERAIVDVVTDQELRAALVSRGYQRVIDFSWEAAAARMLQLYETVGSQSE